LKVRIVQCLCPQRHCLMGVAYESPDGEADPAKMEALRKTIADLVERVINPWCAICESRSFIYEDEATRFRTLAEAERWKKCSGGRRIF
jgi:hypothetical protein